MSAFPGLLVDGAWLEPRLGEPDLRVYDCTAVIDPDAEGSRRFASGRSEWAEAHIPGSAFADLLTELSRHDEVDWFMLPEPEAFAAAAGAIGLGDGTRVVLYDRVMNIWSARLWWALRVYGFDEVAVLDGGWQAWTLDRRPVSSEPSSYPAARFVPRLRPELVATKHDVLAAISDPDVCLVNAVGEEQHLGRGGLHVGRLGHIPSSANVPFMDIVDPETHAYLPPERLRAAFERRGVAAGGRTITYCGAAIAAASDAFALALLGEEDVTVYDGSLREWALDPSLPLVVG